MREETKVLLGRTFDFGIRTLKVLKTLIKRFDYDVICQQLAKSATSIGANYEEAQAAESKKDFIHKIGIVLKESRESHYWLRVISSINNESKNDEKINELLLEATELQKIFSAIKLSAQKK